MSLNLTEQSHVLVLTGAGISAESGVPTFRDINGLWEGHDVTQVASPDGFASDPRLVWKFYSMRRAAMTGIEPNAGHRAIVALEERLGDRFLLATQNVDGLHAKAGSRRMVEMHGNLMTTRCSRCDREPFADTTVYADNKLPVCGVCQRAGRESLLRPHIVWFGESLDPAVLDRIAQFVKGAGKHLIFVAVGTSGLVFPAAGLVDVTRQVGGTSYLVNLDPPANVSAFDHVLLGPATQKLPELFG